MPRLVLLTTERCRLRAEAHAARRCPSIRGGKTPGEQGEVWECHSVSQAARQTCLFLFLPSLAQAKRDGRVPRARAKPSLTGEGGGRGAPHGGSRQDVYKAETLTLPVERRRDHGRS